jgi:hypothetical protein
MSSRYPISRRTILRGIGTAMALPMLDAMMPGAVGGVARAAAEAAGTAGNAAAPVRMAMFFLPNGMCMEDWMPAGEGECFELPPTLRALQPLRDQVTVMTGLALDNARAKGDGPGDHARSAAAFLTGAHPYKTAGKDIKLGISVDQLAAKEIGTQTRLPSLEVGLDKGAMAGNCDSGYACAYSSNISWSSETTPVPKEVNPAKVFDRLFGPASEREAAEGRAKRLMYRKSILDFVAGDAKRLSRELGKADQRKLDEFQTSVREIEQRVERDRQRQAQAKAESKVPDVKFPDEVPDDPQEHFRLMADMLVLAFQRDLTRVSSFMVASDGSDRTYRQIGVTEGHHTLSHHGGNKEKIDQIRKIDKFHVEQFAYFLKRLADIKEANGKSILDNSMVLFGCGIGDGNRHNHNDLPILLAGKGGGSIAGGRHLKYERNTPLCNLYVSMLQRMGIETETFATGKGTISGLEAA